MTVSRRTVIKLGLGAGAVPLLSRSSLLAAEGPPPAAAAEGVIRARRLPLEAVRLTGGPLQHAQQLDGAYLLELEADRMLAYYRERAGLSPKAEPYGGWDGDGRNLTGHIAGHHLSAVSLMYAATGDARFKERADYIVSELKEVQDAHGDGYLSALAGGRECFGALARGEIRSGSFDLNGEWSPWYTLHKTYAGLRDAYRFTDDPTALEVEVRFAEWAEGILADLDDAQLQLMMNTEFGGMNEVLVDLYADTGDERWLDLSYKFEHRAFIQPLQRGQDDLPGKHGNTAIPKIMGSVDRFTLTGRPADLLAASFFWESVVQHHSFSSGGHGQEEYFGPADELAEHLDGRTAESCNVYNMLKLTRELFQLRPDAHYADFQERALFNHALASIDPEDGRMCYMVPVGPGVQHEYQDMLRSFTCCVGSGMENHALHGDGIYYEDGDRLWVSLYAPSTAEWADAGVKLAMETDLPEGETATLRMTLGAPRQFTLALRKPYWAGEGFGVRVNGQPVDTTPGGQRQGMEMVGQSQYAQPEDGASTWVEITRRWRSGDAVEVALPKTLRLEPTPDDPRRASILWGPLVLAGDLGPERERGGGRRGAPPQPVTVPVLVAAERPVSSWLKPVPGSPGTFRTDGVGTEPDAEGRAHEVDFQPFFRLHRRTYSTYWDLYTPDEWQAEKARYAAEAERLRKLEAATVAFVQPGVPPVEQTFNVQSGERGGPAFIQGRSGRGSSSWFSYDLPVEAEEPMTLVLTFFSGDRRSLPATFDVLVDGQPLAHEELDRTDPPRFFDVEHPIPTTMVQGKDKVTLRFQAAEGSRVATVFGVRLIRGDAAR